jgi:selenoprotein W-related protein
MFRATWLAQELLTTFDGDIEAVYLIPDDSGGVFEIRAGRHIIWSRQQEGAFPEAKHVKQRIRDIFFKDKKLGHSDEPDNNCDLSNQQ